MLNIEDSIFLVVDVQSRFSGMMHEEKALYHSIERLLKAVKILDVPILHTEQAPDKLGPTVTSLAELLPGKAIAKRSFSCWGASEFVEALQKAKRRQVIVTGIETHVCIYQTARDLHKHGYEVFVVADATSARTLSNKEITLSRLRHEAITVMCAESVICELLQTAEHPKFREVMAYIK
jgi:nicotinamidase-related amidase